MDSAEMPLFVKGYRLDPDKIVKLFDIRPPYRAVDLEPVIIRCIDRDSYRYIANGYEPNRHLNLMIVMESGYDPVELMNTPMPPSDDETLLDIARTVCTPDVWPCYDDIDLPLTFWERWEKEGGCQLGEIKNEGSKEQAFLRAG